MVKKKKGKLLQSAAVPIFCKMKTCSSLSIVFSAFLYLTIIGKPSYQKTALTLPQIENKVLIVFKYYICCSPPICFSVSFPLVKKKKCRPQLLTFWYVRAEGLAHCRLLYLGLTRRKEYSKIPVFIGLIWCSSPQSHSKPNKRWVRLANYQKEGKIMDLASTSFQLESGYRKFIINLCPAVEMSRIYWFTDFCSFAPPYLSCHRPVFW